MKRFLLSLIISAFGILGTVSADVPRTLSFQGYFAGADGGALQGARQFLFAIYDVPTGGSALFVENINVLLDNGMLNVVLGLSAPMRMPFDKQYFMEVTNITDNAVYPRIQLSASAYAIRSSSLSLPYSDSVSVSSSALTIKNTGSGDAVTGISSGNLGVLGGYDAGLYAESYNGNFGSVGSDKGGVRGVCGSDTSCKGFLGVFESGTAGIYGGDISNALTLGCLGTPSYGVYGDYNQTNWGMIGSNDKAAYFEGRVVVTGTLEKLAGSFKIDHPLDPENKYLSHSFVESPDMKNIYDGLVTLGKDGSAEIVLPDWFEALNKDFRYQLTCVGAYAPVYISKEIESNRFEISGGREGLKVSWQVTGIRKDKYAEAHRIPVESEKSASEKGKYLVPALYGQPKEKSIVNPPAEILKKRKK